MKKFIYFIFLIFLFLLGCKSSKLSDAEIIKNIADSIEIVQETSENLMFPTSFQYADEIIDAQWFSYDDETITNTGTVKCSSEQKLVTVYVVLTLNNESMEKYFDIIVLPLPSDDIVNNIFSLLEIPTSTASDILLKNYIKYDDKIYKISWESSDDNILTKTGKITYNIVDKDVTLTAKLLFNDIEYTKTYSILIEAFDTTDMANYLESLSFPTVITDNLQFDTSITINDMDYEILWSSSNTEALNNNGIIGICLANINVDLLVSISIGNVILEKNFNLAISKTNNELLSSIIQKKISIPKVISNDIFLPTNLGYNLVGKWTSSNTSVISDEGIINSSLNATTKVTLTIFLNLGGENMTINYNTVVQPLKHFIMNNTFNGQKENLTVNDEGKLVLTEGKLQGTYFSEEIITHDFQELVPTWCSTSSKYATCELQISVKVNGTFSDYISYKPWGFGLNNGLKTQTNNLVKLVEDEMKILNNKSANAIKFKLILNRETTSTASPEVSLITFALNSVNYTYDFDKTLLKNYVYYDVPKLYQHDVPSIGNSICSPTSCTMLLKYKGYDFINQENFKYEHEYIARTAYDHSNSIFGNWVYNCVTMSAFGERAYVKRFFNTNEFLYSLQTIGPMAASIKGTVYYYSLTTNSNSQYTTGGHLLVVTGYEITDTETYIYINDPNVKGTAIKMTLNNFLNVWRNISYIIE